MPGQQTLPRLLRALCLPGLLAVVLMFTACGGTNVPTVPTAQQLIANAQAAIRKVTSYHFNLVADHPGTGGLLTIMSADGDILVPDKLRANANVIALGSVTKVQIIAIGAKQYVTDPITGNWQAVTDLLDPRAISDPQTGVASILGHSKTLAHPPIRAWMGPPAGAFMARLIPSTWRSSLVEVHQQALSLQSPPALGKLITYPT